MTRREEGSKFQRSLAEEGWFRRWEGEVYRYGDRSKYPLQGVLFVRRGGALGGWFLRLLGEWMGTGVFNVEPYLQAQMKNLLDSRSFLGGDPYMDESGSPSS